MPTGGAAARVHREGRIASALLQVAALSSRLESNRATAHNSGDHGECNKQKDRLHSGKWYWLPSSFSSALLFMLFIMGSYGDRRMGLGPALRPKSKKVAQRIVPDIEVGLWICG